MATGHHAALAAKVGPRRTVAVVGDGAVGLCAVIAARRLGAEQIVILGRHPDRIAIAEEFGATDVVGERGDEAVARVRELTGGLGAHSVLECVGLEQATVTALAIVRPGGAVGRVGVPQEVSIPEALATFMDNVRIAGGPAPARVRFAPHAWTSALDALVNYQSCGVDARAGELARLNAAVRASEAAARAKGLGPLLDELRNDWQALLAVSTRVACGGGPVAALAAARAAVRAFQAWVAAQPPAAG